MENNQVFMYEYSAATNKAVEQIRSRYLPKEENKLDTLRRLDNRAKTAGVIEALTTGIIGALIFGIGMCFGLDVFAGADWLTVLFCVIGAAVMIPAYRIYKYVSEKTKARLTPEILRLSDEILGN